MGIMSVVIARSPLQLKHISVPAGNHTILLLHTLLMLFEHSMQARNNQQNLISVVINMFFTVLN
jgi:hypothetical protein